MKALECNRSPVRQGMGPSRGSGRSRSPLMAFGFSVLASGSKGNASLIHLDNFEVLLDVGLGPRVLTDRLDAVGCGWNSVRSAIITHTHGDHARDATLGWLAHHRITLFCHHAHLEEAGHRPGFRKLREAGLIREFDDRPFLIAPGLWVEAFELRHCGATFGYRIEGKGKRRGRSATLGYLTDTGCWDPRVADALADVDLLGVEFNHDVEMERRSGRSPALIWRNLGDRGHLSNDQASELLSAVLDRSGPGAVTQVVQLHLSEHCNRPALARELVKNLLRERDRRARIFTANQSIPLARLPVKPPVKRRQTAMTAGFPWET